MSTLSDLNVAVRSCEHLKDPRMKATLGYAKALARSIDMHLSADASVGDVVKLSATLLPQYSIVLGQLGLSAKDLVSREKILAETRRTNQQVAKLEQEVEQLSKRNNGMVPAGDAASTDEKPSDEELKTDETEDELSKMRSRRSGTA